MEGENPAALMKAIETVASLSILAVFGLSAAAKGVYMYRACPPSQRPLWVGAIFLEVEVMILFTGAMGNRDMAGGLLLLCVYLGAVFARIDTLLPRLPLLCGQTRWTALPGGLLLLSSAVALLVLYDCITPPGQPPMAPPAACNSSHLGRKPPAYIFFLAVFAGQTIGRVLQLVYDDRGKEIVEPNSAPPERNTAKGAGEAQATGKQKGRGSRKPKKAD